MIAFGSEGAPLHASSLRAIATCPWSAVEVAAQEQGAQERVAPTEASELRSAMASLPAVGEVGRARRRRLKVRRTKRRRK